MKGRWGSEGAGRSIQTTPVHADSKKGTGSSQKRSEMFHIYVRNKCGFLCVNPRKLIYTLFVPS